MIKCGTWATFLFLAAGLALGAWGAIGGLAIAFGPIVGGGHLLQLDNAQVAATDEITGGIPDIGDAAAHTGGKIASGRAENDDAAAGHVFATVVAQAFDDGRRARVTHREAFAGDAVEEGFAGDGDGGAVPAFG